MYCHIHAFCWEDRLSWNALFSIMVSLNFCKVCQVVSIPSLVFDDIFKICNKKRNKFVEKSIVRAAIEYLASKKKCPTDYLLEETVDL